MYIEEMLEPRFFLLQLFILDCYFKLISFFQSVSQPADGPIDQSIDLFFKDFDIWCFESSCTICSQSYGPWLMNILSKENFRGGQDVNISMIL